MFHFFTRHPVAEVAAITVIVDESSDEFIRFEHRKQFKRLPLGQNVTGFEQLAARHEIIGLDSGVIVRQLPPPSANHTAIALKHFI